MRFLKVKVLESKIYGLSVENSLYTGREKVLLYYFKVAKFIKPTHKPLSPRA